MLPNQKRTKAPKVSVVIAAYNYAKYLPYALNSILDQTYQDYELIVVNDGSTDNTQDVLTPYLRHPKVRCYHKPNGGQANAENFGIRQSQGPYVAFLDADDCWSPDKLARQIPILEQSPNIGVVYSDARMIGPSGEDIPFIPPARFRGHILRHLFGDNFIPFSSSVVRRELLDRHGLFDESLRMSTDYDLWLRLSITTEFDYVPAPLMAYRLGHGQMTSDIQSLTFWASLVEKRFVERSGSLVTRAMIKHRDFGNAYARFRRCERTDPLEALRCLARMLSLRPSSTIPYKSLARLILVDLLGVLQRP